MNKRVIAKMRLSESPDLDDYFNGSRIAEQVTGVTRGKVYDVLTGRSREMSET